MGLNEKQQFNNNYSTFWQDERVFSIDEKNRAAYALNLCTVSVGQIIDYADLEIMEQEYEAVLNNLNLQNMPKDQALLNILTQLLDVISFFRIQKKEKEKIEKEYQLKMKDVIWNTLPNIAFLITSNSFSSTASRVGAATLTWGLSEIPRIALMVGICYMNYRKNISQYHLEKNEELWKLHRSEMEQFHALQRELFTTSWRLADVYKFDDELRLSERQIHQYNEILRDEDIYRKFERLESIKEQFKAYPPYLYYLANTANILSQKEKRKVNKDVILDISVDKRNSYLIKAKTYYKELLDNKNYNILRKDPVISACALEYIELLMEQKHSNDDDFTNVIYSYIELAEDMSGGSFDILELCALAYLRIKKIDKAMDLFRKLFNEGYNQTINAQILSIYYAKEKKQDDRNLLVGYVRDEYLYPMPNNEEDLNKSEKIFVENQIKLLRNSYCLVLKEYIRDRETKFTNDTNRNKKCAIIELRKIYSRFFNDMVTDLNILFAYTDEELNTVTKRLVWHLNNIENDTFKKKPVAQIFEDWTFELVERSLRKIMMFHRKESSSSTINEDSSAQNNEDSLDDFMDSLSKYEERLRDFVKKTGMIDPHKIDDMFVSDSFELLKPFEEFDSEEEKKKRKWVIEASNIAKVCSENIVHVGAQDYYLVRNSQNDNEFICKLDEMNVPSKDREYYFAMIKKSGQNSETIMFNTEGIQVCENKKVYPYTEITNNDEKTLKFGGHTYYNDKVNMVRLGNMLTELRDRCKPMESQFDRLFSGYSDSINRKNNKIEFISTLRQLFN